MFFYVVLNFTHWMLCMLSLMKITLESCYASGVLSGFTLIRIAQRQIFESQGVTKLSKNFTYNDQRRPKNNSLIIFSVNSDWDSWKLIVWSFIFQISFIKFPNQIKTIQKILNITKICDGHSYHWINNRPVRQFILILFHWFSNYIPFLLSFLHTVPFLKFIQKLALNYICFVIFSHTLRVQWNVL